MANTRLAMAVIPVMGRNHFFAIYSVVGNVTLGLAPIGWGLLIDAVGARAGLAGPGVEPLHRLLRRRGAGVSGDARPGPPAGRTRGRQHGGLAPRNPDPIPATLLAALLAARMRRDVKLLTSPFPLSLPAAVCLWFPAPR